MITQYRTNEEATELFLKTARQTSKYKKAIENLYYWQQGGDSFTCMLYSLIAKADYWNKESLAEAFPYNVLAFDDWQKSTDMGTELFKNHGLLK